MIQSIRGTKDTLPESMPLWHFVEQKFREVSALFTYEELRTPIFEKTEVFSRSIGENTDIVNKEMYTFTDRGGESVTLRPEMTAALVRSVIQNSLLHQNPLLRLWYFGPFFRYERPQKGRLRQFHQYGAECIGSPFPEADAEVIILADSLIKSLGITDYKLLINTLGSDESRTNYRNALIEYLMSFKENLSDDSRVRLETNPLRVLDSKDQRDIDIVQAAPIILDYLDGQSSDHFGKLRSILDSAEIKYIIQPRLVRGLDYYCHSVFEFQSEALGAQDSFGGGGRYDGLFSQLGGKQNPAVGFAMGVERLLLIIDSLENSKPQKPVNDFNIVLQNPDYFDFAQVITSKLRQKGYKVGIDLQRRSFKAQMREANSSGAKYAIIIGESEFENHQVQLKNMQTGEQKLYDYNSIDEIVI
jgi:histidyl-tRNA synthetase